jgi:hypothetical protein
VDPAEMGKKYPFQSVGKQLAENKPRCLLLANEKKSIIEFF